MMLLHLPDFRETENLEPAAVGENRFVPIHELVQAISSPDHVEAGAQIQMVGVAENDLGVHLVEFTQVERLHAGLRADGHEHGRFDDAVRGGQSSETRFGRRIGFEEFKHQAR